MTPGHMKGVLASDYRCVSVRLLVHKKDAAKSLDHIHSGTYNGILHSDTEPLDNDDLQEIVEHEQGDDNGAAGDGYIDWSAHPEPRQWVLLACVEKRGEGQRFFSTKSIAEAHSVPIVDRNRGAASHLWICDNSGDDPDHSDDGPLRLDPERPVKVGQDPGSGIGVYAMVSVICERDSIHNSDNKSRCGVSIRELLWLVRHGWIKPDQLEFSDSLQPMLDLLQVKAL